MPVRSGGSSNSAVVDHFAPNWIVGNVPNGDSPVPYSQGGFHYVPDIGDGAGLAAALAAAAVVGGTVTMRFGIYDLNLAGSPVAPMTIGPNVSLTGPGPILDNGGNLIGPILGRVTGDQGVFVLVGTAGLSSIAILSDQSVGPYAGSTGIVSCVGANATIRDVTIVNLSVDATIVARHGLEVLGGNVTVLNHVVLSGPGFHNAAVGNWTAGLYVTGGTGTRITMQDSEIGGWDVGVFEDGGAALPILTVIGTNIVLAARRSVYQAVAGYLSMDSCRLSVSQLDAMIAELRASADPSLAPKFSSLRGAGLGLQTVPAILLHGLAAPTSAGRARIQGNTLVWTRAGAVIELGTGAEQLDRCSVEHNILVNSNGAGIGVLVSNANANKTIIGGGSIEATTPISDLGTLTFTYPIAV